MRTVRIAAALGLAGILALGAPLCAMAGTEKPESMDQETWERLQDNVLEYDELEDLVELYNPMYRQMVSNIDLSLKPIEDAAAGLRGAADDMMADARGMKDVNDILSKAYRSAAKGYREGAKNFDKILRSAQSGTRNILGSTRKQMTAGVQQLMLGYYQALASKELIDTGAELAQAAWESTVTQRNLGMATDTDVESAQKAFQSAGSRQQTLDDQLTGLKQQLLYMTGWSYDAQSDVGAPPVPDLSRIEAMDFEADLNRAIGNNYTLIEQRSVSGKSTASHTAKFRTLEESEAKLKIQLESLYQAVLEGKMTYEAAQTALESARITMNGTETNYQMGMVGRLEYLQLKTAYLQQKMAADQAALSLVQDMETYYWAVEGLADIS